MGKSSRGISDERGQMAVELAVVTPIILLVLVIIIDMLIYANECARFDHLAPQQVLAHASSSSSGSYDLEARRGDIESALGSEFSKNGSWVSVERVDADAFLASTSAFRCVFHFVPWPFSLSTSPPSIEHACTLVVDPYTPSELL